MSSLVPSFSICPSSAPTSSIAQASSAALSVITQTFVMTFPPNAGRRSETSRGEKINAMKLLKSADDHIRIAEHTGPPYADGPQPGTPRRLDACLGILQYDAIFRLDPETLRRASKHLGIRFCFLYFRS